MKVGAPQAALITGAGSGVGRAFALDLAKDGVRLSLVDYSESGGLETLKLVEDVYAKLGRSYELRAIFTKCDVSKPEEVALAFEQHQNDFKRLDICINNAGILERGEFLKDRTGAWRKVVDVNLLAVIDCTRLAIQAMLRGGNGGTVLNVGSSAGLYPSFETPLYSASKAGVILFSRSLGYLAKQKIRVNVICPELLATGMTKTLDPKLLEMFGGFIPMERFLQGARELMEDETKAGACLWVSNRRGLEYWPTPEEKKRYLLRKLVPSDHHSHL